MLITSGYGCWLMASSLRLISSPSTNVNSLLLSRELKQHQKSTFLFVLEGSMWQRQYRGSENALSFTAHQNNIIRCRQNKSKEVFTVKKTTFPLPWCISYNFLLAGLTRDAWNTGSSWFVPFPRKSLGYRWLWASVFTEKQNGYLILHKLLLHSNFSSRALCLALPF